MDVPPVENIASSASLHESVDVKKMAADVTEDKVEELPSPTTTQPPHTSPDFSFASEVPSQNWDLQEQIHAARHHTIIFETNTIDVKHLTIPSCRGC